MFSSHVHHIMDSASYLNLLIFWHRWKKPHKQCTGCNHIPHKLRTLERDLRIRGHRSSNCGLLLWVAPSIDFNDDFLFCVEYVYAVSIAVRALNAILIDTLTHSQSFIQIMCSHSFIPFVRSVVALCSIEIVVFTVCYRDDSYTSRLYAIHFIITTRIYVCERLWEHVSVCLVESRLSALFCCVLLLLLFRLVFVFVIWILSFHLILRIVCCVCDAVHRKSNRIALHIHIHSTHICGTLACMMYHTQSYSSIARGQHWLGLPFDNFDFQFQTNCYACNIDRSYTSFPFRKTSNEFEKPRIVRTRRNICALCFRFNNFDLILRLVPNLWVFILV